MGAFPDKCRMDNAVENNYLTREELNAQVDAAVACRKGDKAACAEQKRLERLNKERDLRTAKKLFELAKDAKGSPRRFEQLEVKVSKIQEELARLEIDFAKIPKEFQKASWNPQRFSLADNQFGHKVGRHATEHGFDMKTSSGRESFKKFIYEIAKRPDELRVGTFNGQGIRQGANHARGSVLFRIKGNNVVVTSPKGEFITILKMA